MGRRSADRHRRAERFLPGRRAGRRGRRRDRAAASTTLIAGFEHVVLTQDWHPAGHSSFASSHRGQAALRDDRHALWAADAVAGPLHPGYGRRGLPSRHSNGRKAELVIRKGFRPAIDSYSAFFENDHETPTGLGGYLRERGIGQITLVGLATDFCVAFSALDAVRQGFATTRPCSTPAAASISAARWKRCWHG